mgnify:CR=1 FL=1
MSSSTSGEIDFKPGDDVWTLLSLHDLGSMFPGAKERNLYRYFPLIVEALREARILTAPMLAMALGTIAAETAGFEPIAEFQSKFNTSSHSKRPFDLYDRRSDLGNQGPPDGFNFRGAGFVQLTGRANFETYGDRLGINLIAHPERALEPKVAADILALFLADKEMRIVAALNRGDLAGARKLVNGGRHGLERFVPAYQRARDLLAARRAR